MASSQMLWTQVSTVHNTLGGGPALFPSARPIPGLFQGVPLTAPPWPLDQHGLPLGCPTNSSYGLPIGLGLGKCSGVGPESWGRNVCNSQGTGPIPNHRKQRLTIGLLGVVMSQITLHTTHTHTPIHIHTGVCGYSHDHLSLLHF